MGRFAPTGADASRSSSGVPSLICASRPASGSLSQSPHSTIDQRPEDRAARQRLTEQEMLTNQDGALGPKRSPRKFSAIMRLIELGCAARASNLFLNSEAGS